LYEQTVQFAEWAFANFPLARIDEMVKKTTGAPGATGNAEKALRARRGKSKIPANPASR
jgi:hypothetical protein